MATSPSLADGGSMSALAPAAACHSIQGGQRPVDIDLSPGILAQAMAGTPTRFEHRRHEIFPGGTASLLRLALDGIAHPLKQPGQFPFFDASYASPEAAERLPATARPQRRTAMSARSRHRSRPGSS